MVTTSLADSSTSLRLAGVRLPDRHRPITATCTRTHGPGEKEKVREIGREIEKAHGSRRGWYEGDDTTPLDESSVFIEV